MGLGSLIRMEGKRCLSRTEFKFAVTAVLAITAVAFIESCIRFYGFDAGALPSASYGWTWNMDPLQIQAMHVFAYFLIFIIAASVFADNFLCDTKSGVVTCVVSRCPASAYFVANAVVTFAGGAFVIFLGLLLSQLLALLIFPLAGTFQGHFNTPVYVLDTSKPLFPQLAANYPYLNNIVYIFYASFWAGIMALLSFSLSFYFKKNRLVIIGVPTTAALLSWYAVPALTDSSVILTHFRYLFPGAEAAEMSVAYFVLAPLTTLAVALALVVFALKAKRDVFL